MRLSKVKKICTNAVQLTLVDAKTPQNMVLQWIGTTDAMYSVEGTRLSKSVIRAMWELSEAQMIKMEERPAEYDQMVLENVPALVAEEALPYRGIAYINGYLAVMDEEENLYFVRESLLAPCMDGRIRLDVIRTGREAFLAVYTDGKISAVVRAEKHETVKALMRQVELMSGLTPWMDNE